MDVCIGATIYGSDASVGSAVDRVLIDPATWEVTHIVVRTGGLRPRYKLVPMSLVERWEEKGAILRVTSEELRALPDYIERDYVVPRGVLASAAPPTRTNLPATLLFTEPGFPYGPGLIPHPSHVVDRPVFHPAEIHSGPIEIRGGAVAEAVDGEIGLVDRLLLDPYTNRVSSFVVRAGRLFGRDVAVPLEWVGYVDPHRIRFAATRAQLGQVVGVPAGNYLAVFGTRGRVKARRAA
ncbi:MAG: hypothetical protein HYY04_11665 [Chloroflexi bacterium]|nr:hypothetical protein [Chloroflexota bacterium]